MDRQEYRAQQHEMRALVDSYYSIQKLRMGAGNKERSYEQGYDLPNAYVPLGEDEPLAEPTFLAGVKEDLEGIEGRIAKYLESQVKASPLGQWCLSIDGVGPVLAAGLLAYIDFYRCCCPQYRELKGKDRLSIPKHRCPGLATAGAIHRFAGLVDKEKQPWLPGQRRPYNVRLKTICWKIADQFRRQNVDTGKLALPDADFVKLLKKEKKYQDLSKSELMTIVKTKKKNMARRMSKLEDRLYVRLYRERKERDTQYNEEGRFRAEALAMLEKARKNKWGISKEQRDCWASGKRQPIGIELRAMRYAASMFISHFHYIGREIYFGDQVKPWVIEHSGHVHYIAPPNWPMKREGKK